MPIFVRDAEQFTVGDRLPVLPLRDVVFFPYVVMPLLVGRESSLAAIDASTAAGEQFLLLVTQRDGDSEEPAAGGMHRVGVVGRILQQARLPNGTTRILVEGIAVLYFSVGANKNRRILGYLCKL